VRDTAQRVATRDSSRQAFLTPEQRRARVEALRPSYYECVKRGLHVPASRDA
jgi:hypothetical protein